MGILAVEVGTWVTGGSAALIALVFGWPAWRLALRQNKKQEEEAAAAKERQKLHDLAAAVARVLAGTDDPSEIPATSEGNPSIRDLLHDVLEETATNTSEIAILRAILENHLAVPHGGPIPDYLLRRAATAIGPPPPR